LSDLLAAAGVLVAAGASAATVLLPPGRLRAGAMLAALVLVPVLILGDQWHTDQIVDLRDDSGRILALAALALAIVAPLAYLFRRWPLLLPLAIVAALPFRVPLNAGGDTANLLVPLYLVIAGGVVATLLRDWKSASPTGGTGGEAENGATPRPQASPPVTGPAGRSSKAPSLPAVLSAVVVLYALQSLYSEDFSKALQNVCFFLVPFTVAYALLSDVRWSRRLLTLTLVVVAAEAVAFVLIGSVEYLSRNLIWNDQVIRSNEFHTYFRVNSVFWDPNVYGRYLALVMVVVTSALLWARDRRTFWILAGTLAILWLGLAQTFSQSSYIALLAGLAALAALRWSLRWTLAAVAVGAVGAVLVVTLVGGAGFSFNRINIDTSGRANLVQGGVDLFAERPLWGYGSGSFQAAYREHQAKKNLPVSISHTEPVTVAAEQGLLGFIAYVALIVVALWTMASGIRGPPPPVGRIAIFATFIALLVHTMAYAGFFEDPITWVLLAIGASLAAAPAAREGTATAAPAVRDPA
jgi:putative inorganic carbon (hco3(-)) transporter